MNSRSKESIYKSIKGEVSLWDLLTIMAGAVAFGNAYAAAKVSKIQSLNFYLALAVGLLVAVSCIWTVRIVGERVLKLIMPNAEKQDEPGLWGKISIYCLYLTAVIWLVASGFLGYYITKIFIESCL